MKTKFVCILMSCCIYAILAELSLKTMIKGAVKINLKYIEYCRGPKKGNLSIFTQTLTNGGVSPVNDSVIVNHTMSKDSGPMQVQMKFYPWNPLKKQFQLGFTLKSDNVCQCLACKDLFTKYCKFREPYEKCIVAKGTYQSTVNMTKLALLWFGNKLFPGTFRIKSSTFTPQGNLGCSIMEIEVMKY